jgi:hypothetical protein
MITSFKIFESEFDGMKYSLFDDNSSIADNLGFEEAIEKAGLDYFNYKKIYVMLDEYSNFIDWISEWNEMHPNQTINQAEVYQYDEEQVMEEETPVVSDIQPTPPVEIKEIGIDPKLAFQELENGNVRMLYDWLKTNPNVDEFIDDELPICLAIIHAADDRTAYNAILGLLDHMVDVNGVDKTKKTALHYACNGLLKRTIELLLDYGAEVKTEESPIPYLAIVGLAYSELSLFKKEDLYDDVQDIIGLLLEEGASFKEKFEGGLTISEYYEKLGIKEFVIS